MDPEGDCDITSAKKGRELKTSPWKRSMDPEGDCDIFIAYDAVTKGVLWKRSMDPEGDCDTAGFNGVVYVNGVVEKVDGP